MKAQHVGSPAHAGIDPLRMPVLGVLRQVPPHTRGIDPDCRPEGFLAHGFPRTRGDRPFTYEAGTWTRRVPPHTRG